MPNQPDDIPQSSEPFHEAATDLHAAHFAILLHIGLPDLLEAASAYSTYVIDQTDGALAPALERHEEVVGERARTLAEELGESLYAQGLRQIGQTAT